MVQRIKLNILIKAFKSVLGILQDFQYLDQQSLQTYEKKNGKIKYIVN